MDIDELFSVFNENLKVVKTPKRIIDRHVYPEEQPALKDTDKIRVYHGCNRLNDCLLITSYGLTGKARAKRIYSYEANNNPKGLFVTVDLDIAKQFGNYIIEFSTIVKDLESPVWPKGSYTVQGQMASYFDGPEDREEERLRARRDASKNFGDSDRPELADSLYSSYEMQALFTGELDPNNIKAVWVSMDPTKTSSVARFSRLSRKEFLKRYYDDELDESDHSRLIFKPREKFDIVKFLDKLHDDHPQLNSTKEESISSILNILKNMDDVSLLTYVWPHHLEEAKKQIQNYEIK